MTRQDSNDKISQAVIHTGDVGGDLILRADGDIVAGNKTIIQKIIHQIAKKIITAPYKFLASYEITDKDIFYGRSTVIDELTGKVPRYKTVIINGRSGSGKTSLINAGLIRVSRPLMSKCTLRRFLVSQKICIFMILLYILNLLVLDKFDNSF